MKPVASNNSVAFRRQILLLSIVIVAEQRQTHVIIKEAVVMLLIANNNNKAAITISWKGNLKQPKVLRYFCFNYMLVFGKLCLLHKRMKRDERKHTRSN